MHSSESYRRFSKISRFFSINQFFILTKNFVFPFKDLEKIHNIHLQIILITFKKSNTRDVQQFRQYEKSSVISDDQRPVRL